MALLDLRQSPFFILDVSPRDSRDRIVEAYETGVSDRPEDETNLLRAQQLLMAPKSRLQAEISWLPGVAPNRARALVREAAKLDEHGLADLPPLAAANLAAFRCSYPAPPTSICEFIVTAQASLDVASVTTLLNAERRVSGFPEVSEALVGDALKQLAADHAAAVNFGIVAIDRPGASVSLLLEKYLTQPSLTSFLDDLTELYNAWASSALNAVEEELKGALGRIKSGAGTVTSERASLITNVESWRDLAAPRQKVFAHRRLKDPRSEEIFGEFRAAGLFLNNIKDDPAAALELAQIALSAVEEVEDLKVIALADLDILEGNIDAAASKADVAALDALVTSANDDHSNLSRSIARGEFREGGVGLSGSLFAAFDRAYQACRGSRRAQYPIIAVRSLAIDLNNKSNAPDDALALIRALQAYANLPVSDEVAITLADDERTLKKLSLEKQLSRAIEKKEHTKIIDLIDGILPLVRDSDERANLVIARNNVSEARKKVWIKYGSWGVLAVFILMVIVNSDKKSTSTQNTTYTPSYQTPNQAPAYSPPTYGDTAEIPPPLGTNGTVTRPELRYCMFESARMDEIKIIMGSAASDRLISEYNKLVDNWNSRCQNTQYYAVDKTAIDFELAYSQDKINSDAMARWSSWKPLSPDPTPPKAKPASQPAPPVALLNTSSPGDVKKIQNRLNQLGFSTSVTGVWTDSTLSLMLFKSANGLPVDEIWDRKTQTALFSRGK